MKTITCNANAKIITDEQELTGFQQFLISREVDRLFAGWKKYVSKRLRDLFEEVSINKSSCGVMVKPDKSLLIDIYYEIDDAQSEFDDFLDEELSEIFTEFDQELQNMIYADDLRFDIILQSSSVEIS